MKGTILTVLGTLSISGSALRFRMPRIAALADFCRMRGLHWVESDGVTAPSRLPGQTSVCSAISSASSTSMPRYLTVLSSLV